MIFHTLGRAGAACRQRGPSYISIAGVPWCLLFLNCCIKLYLSLWSKPSLLPSASPPTTLSLLACSFGVDQSNVDCIYREETHYFWKEEEEEEVVAVFCLHTILMADILVILQAPVFLRLHHSGSFFHNFCFAEKH